MNRRQIKARVEREEYNIGWKISARDAKRRIEFSSSRVEAIYQQSFHDPLKLNFIASLAKCVFTRLVFALISFYLPGRAQVGTHAI